MTRTLGPAEPGIGGRPCPICGKPADVVLSPFCSKRCADIDLHKWLKGGYAVPSQEPGDQDETPDEPA